MMHLFVFFILSTQLLHPPVNGIRFRSFLHETPSNYDDSSLSSNTADIQAAESFGATSERSYGNASEIRTDSFSSAVPGNETSSETDERNSTSAISDSPQPETHSTDTGPNISNTTRTVVTLTEIFANESQSPSPQSSSSTSGNEGVPPSTGSVQVEQSSTITADDGEEPEGVARGKPTTTETANTTTSKPETLYQKTLALISDTYTLSILIPIAAGVIFASTIIVTIATCRCLRRRCRRRRLRRKILPDTVKNLRPSDRARLLAESSDEEF